MNLIEEEQQLLKDIFHVIVNPNQSGYAAAQLRDSLVVLTQFPRDIGTLGARVSLLKNTTYFDSLLMERLQLPKTETLRYLAECLARCNYQRDKPWNQTPEVQSFINYSVEIIRNFMYLAATDTDIFAEQHVIDPEAEKSPDKIIALSMRLMTYFQLHGFDHEVLASIYPRIVTEEPKGSTFQECFFEVLLARQRFQTIADSKSIFYLSLLNSLLGIETFKSQFVTLPRAPFVPEKHGNKAVQGNVMDLSTPFGLFARPSLLGTLAAYNQEIKANMNLEEKIYADFGKIKYKKDLDIKVRYYSTMEAEYLNLLKEVFKQMFKKDTQRVFFEWLFSAVVGNQLRAKLGSRLSGAVNNTISSDGLMMNIYEGMLEINRTILDRSQAHHQKIDPEYFALTQHCKLCQYEPLNNNKQQENPKMEVERKEFGTITQFFFVAFQLLHVAVIPTLHNFREVNETKERLEKEMEKMSRSHPMYQRGEKELQRLKVKFFQYYLVLLDDLKIKSSIRLMDMLLYLLPKWLGIDLPSFRKGRLQLQRPFVATQLPEFLLIDIFEYHQFFCRMKENYIQLVGNEHLHNIIQTTCILLADGSPSTNLYVCANFIELIFYFVMTKKDMVSDVLKQNELAVQNMTIGLVKFYSEIAFTGSSHQFYSKYKYRFYSNKIFTVLWQHEVYRRSLKDISNTDQFKRFINMIMNDSGSCFEEIGDKYEKLKEYDMKRANNSMTQEDLRNQEMMQGAITGNLQQSVSNLKLLRDLSNWSPETFHAIEFLSTVVPMINNMLRTLVDPTSFANNRQIVAKYKFEKEFVLSDLLKIYANLNYKDVLVNEILADQRNYKKEYFATALQKAANENCTDETVLEKFEALIQQLSSAKKEEEDDETVFGEIPDKYLCGLMGCFMKDPVLLPTSGNVVDRMYIHKHLLNDERDPFNRKPLKIAELQDIPKLKQEIEEWKRKRLQELKHATKETKYGKKGEKKKEADSETLFKDNFIKYDE